MPVGFGREGIPCWSRKNKKCLLPHVHGCTDNVDLQGQTRGASRPTGRKRIVGAPGVCICRLWSRTAYRALGASVPRGTYLSREDHSRRPRSTKGSPGRSPTEIRALGFIPGANQESNLEQNFGWTSLLDHHSISLIFVWGSATDFAKCFLPVKCDF